MNFINQLEWNYVNLRRGEGYNVYAAVLGALFDTVWEVGIYVTCRVRGHSWTSGSASAEYGSEEIYCERCGHSRTIYW